MIRNLLLVAIFCAALSPFVYAQESAPFSIETKIPLGPVSGRIDHLAIDVTRQQLYVAELGNNSVAVIDLQRYAVTRRITGLREPQGIAYVPTTNSIYVANGGDGSVRIFNASNFVSLGKIDLGDDADNVRFDAITNRLYVGYGRGALAVIDPTTRRQIATISLKAHPESFELEDRGHRLFVNVPGANEIAVVDREHNKQVASWSTGALKSNFPMTLDEAHQQLAVIFRHSDQLALFSISSGAVLSQLATCEDADDVFVDQKRARLYVSCGEGLIDVFGLHEGIYHHVDHLNTAYGARTSLFVPELDRLLVAVRATLTTPAAVWILRPLP